MANPGPADIAAALMQVAENMAAVVESVTGHRAQLEAAGFSPTAAEAMAVDFYRTLVASMFTPQTPSR